MATPVIESLWTTPQGHLHLNRLQREAEGQSVQHALPVSAEEWHVRAKQLRQTLAERLRLPKKGGDLEVQIHHEIACEGYRIQAISFASAPGIRVTANLYIPEGNGPFPAVLNCHGHWLEGKIAAKVQARGHLLALNGIVTLSVDAAGAGERGEEERAWSYHGASKGGELFLGGDSLLGLQVRDNLRAIDLLVSLPFVDAERIGVTGASGGGNQTMWVAAMDERIKVAVPVVSVGSFEAYVGRCNCVCETLPGGLALAEEWEVLGLIAPRRLLIINALHDQPAFGYEPMSQTSRQLQEIYSVLQVRHHFDWRILNMTHGYHPEASEVMLGWMKHWLCDTPGSTPVALPKWKTAPEETLLCYRKGERPEANGYRAVRRTLITQAGENLANDRAALAKLVGWKDPGNHDWHASRPLSGGGTIGSLKSSREIPLPVWFSADPKTFSGTVRLLLSPLGKSDSFVSEQLAIDPGTPAMTMDLPGTGELNWDKAPVADERLHDASRAALWLGYTLVGEWAEAIASLCRYVQRAAPNAKIQIIAKEETAFAALLSVALAPLEGVCVTEVKMPDSILDESRSNTLVWMVPGFLQWGDLDSLRALARQ